ncbi:histidine kinase famiy protein [Roseateles terrae]|uniref:histidine kinase n=1 Tax=Roseateles terrae TaxID=431060 RepID=A0ABR6GND5_9BURK|nr:histidine kinase famiy protein [Roseateles terrae]MBB3193625.1 PAS domain S-box-containing protein [Roseateles terrae]OWQ89212.1 hybrid sensor histidine kinase/response regulator [Roseateles terrae]
MSSDTDLRDKTPRLPRHDARVQTEGFASSGHGRDIFFAAVQATRMPMVVADPRQPDTPLVFANQAFLEMTGYSEEEIIGKNCRFLQGPETDPSTVALISEALRAERELTVELLNYRKDGSTFWNALFLTPVRNEEGDLLYYFSSQLDVSRRRDAEAALRQAQKMEALGQLTGGIAHDFNNLLQVITGNAEVAAHRLQVVAPNDALMTRSIANVRAAAARSGSLTQQLLAFARKQQLQGRVVNVNDAIHRTVDLASSSLADVHLMLDLDPQTANVRIDTSQFEAALLNLLVNARDAMPGGGRIWIRSSNLRTTAEDVGNHGLVLPGDYVCVCVSDEGDGIPAPILARVMDPFFTTKAERGGTGLGLSMVYGFAKQSGGVATIYSEEKTGTTVRLYFPAVEDSAAPREVPVTQPRSGQGEMILVVDDRPEVAQTAAAMLESAGYLCHVALSARDAMQLLKQEPDIRLLLTDIIMPGSKNGVLLAHDAQRVAPNLKVLLMTGFADGSPDRWDGQSYDIVLKPFTSEDLRVKVRRALDGQA